MAADNRFFDDLARMAGGAASLLSTIRRQVSSDLKERAHFYTNRMDFGSRDEIERLQASVSKYRSEQEQMKKKIAELETSLGGKTKSKPSVKKKSSPSKTKRK